MPKAALEGAALLACPQVTAEGLPGAEVCRSKFPSRKGAQSRGCCRHDSDRSTEHQGGCGAFPSARPPLVGAICPKELLQVIVGPREIRYLIAVEEPWPIAAGDLEEVGQSRGEFASGGPVPCHCPEETAQPPLHGGSSTLVFVLQ